MKFYGLFTDPDRFWTLESHGAADRAFWEFGTKRLAKGWPTPRLKAEKRGRKGDFFTLHKYYGEVPIISDKALSVLRPYFPKGTEVLPVRCERETLFAINVLYRVKCFDPSRSKFSTYSDGQIAHVRKFVALPDVVVDAHFFQVPENGAIVIYSGVVRKAIEKAGLTGRAELDLFSTDSIDLPEPVHQGSGATQPVPAKSKPATKPTARTASKRAKPRRSTK